MNTCNRLEININKLRTNINNIIIYAQKINPSVKFCLPVKADAYGHGLIEIAKNTADLVDYFAVSCLAEGITLRKANINHNHILVFGILTPSQIADLIAYNLEFTISSLAHAQDVLLYCQQHNKQAKIHIKIDTGMNRVGVKPQSVQTIIDFISLNSNLIKLKGLYSHFASADDKSQTGLTQYQIKSFTQLVKSVKSQNPQLICHLANSAGLNYKTAIFDMIRPGIISYGYNINNIANLKISPLLSLKSKILNIKEVEANTGISYNHQYQTDSKTQIAIIPIGYGDGYRQSWSNHQVIISDKFYPIAGRVCMDMTMIDLKNNNNIAIGDEVILLGQSLRLNITMQELANLANTNIYEILCGFTARLPKIYTFNSNK